MADFVKFPKIPRLENSVLRITEKIDGTNAQVTVPENGGPLVVGSRNRVITPGKTTDNFGFAAWVQEHEEAVRALGPGTHYGEWWGPGIGRGYGQVQRTWSLFDYEDDLPTGPIDRVPVLHARGVGEHSISMHIKDALFTLKTGGSIAASGWMQPEGIVVQLGAARFKVILDKTGPSPEQ